jgi:WD40 repeat protein
VFSAAFSPDSRQVVSASADHTAQVWDVATGASIKTLVGHTAQVIAVFSFSGTLIASGSLDGTVKLWESSTGTLLKTLEKHSKCVMSLAFSPSDTSLASAGADHMVQVWNLNSGTLVCALSGHKQLVASVAFSATGTILASASNDQTIQIWDPITGNQLKCLNVGKHKTGFQEEIHFSHDQKSILTSFGKFDINIDLGPRDESIISNKVTLPAYYAGEDGWIFSAATQQHICWIPHECRGYLASNENTIVLGSSAGNVTILDLTQMNSHLRSL